MRIAVLRCRDLPRFVTWEIPNLDELFADDRLLVAEFARRGIEASPVVWSDPDVDWNDYDVALIRSTWDYIDAPGEFLSVLAAIEDSRCRLFNPLAAVRWNGDKRYLLDLAERGVPIVPTYRSDGPDGGGWREAAEREGWRGAVLKPLVGGGGQAVERVAVAGVAGALERLAAERAGWEFLVQPFVDSIQSEGEWSFYYAGGKPSHVLLRTPSAGDFRAHAIYGGSTRPADPSAEDARAAAEILARLPVEALYARLDLVRVAGRLAVMEVELIEPIQYFPLAPHAAGILADAVVAGVR